MIKYRHFKGKVYNKILEAEHSETGENMIVYKDDAGKTFVRPSSMFYGKVEVNGKKIDRYKKIK